MAGKPIPLARSAQVRIPVPAPHAPGGADAPSFAADEGLRALRAQLLLRHFTGPGARPLVVVSPRRGDGRSDLTLALAGALAEAGLRTAVVEADFHAPCLRARAGLGGGPDLESVLRGELSWEAALAPLAGRPGVSVLPANPAPARASALLARPALAQLFAALGAHHDAVLVDSPAWRESGDAHFLAARAGAALLLAPRHRTGVADVARVADGLRAAGAVLVGSVLGARPGWWRRWRAPRRAR